MSLLKQIAERAGVSPSTVTRVLNGSETYNRPFYAERAKRIKAIAEELGYRPNAAARAVRTGRFGSVCLLTGDEHGFGNLPGILINTLCKACHEAELMLSVARLPDEEISHRGDLPAILKRIAADGLLINYTHAIPPGMEAVLACQGLPAVWLNFKRQTDSVYFADKRAAREVTRLLIQRGHRRIAFFAPNYDPIGKPHQRHYSTDDRLAGYRQALKEAGLPEFLYCPGLHRDWTLGNEVGQLFGHSQRPTAVLTMLNSESVVVGALRQGLRIPEDVSICTFTRAVGNGRGLPTAACLIPDWKLGREAIDMLCKRIEQPDSPCRRKIIPIPLMRQHFLHDRR